ncbi:DUF488 family protein [Rhizobium grahamii]|uniref:DUF488 family protein n=1 Tax=Rhizobium grahamii TaxID=1120045 RepID=A0A5Q0C9A5_9HYPH|nr:MULTISPECIES: DUF488 family protein [Rhizobium]QFY60570.1 DUF488 family protein [Rhizobium grahamii]QRM50299.1 DUF488 family protein [Rhizobium sp. BG6]
MAITVVQLGSAREDGEGVRIGTVRRPPRGVPKQEFASRNYYDVWLPILSPSQALVTEAKAATTDAEWAVFVRSFAKEMKVPEASHVLDLLATLSHATHFAIGCYCENENHCHRSVLRRLLEDRGAAFVAERCS